MGGIPFNLGEIHTIGPRTRERMTGTNRVPAMQPLGMSLAGWSAARHGFYFVRQQPEASQLLACASGQGEVWIDHAWRPLHAGEAYATPPSVAHAYRAAGRGIWHVCWVVYAGTGPHTMRFSCPHPTVLRVAVEPLQLAIAGLCTCSAQAAPDEAELNLWLQLVHRRVVAALQPGVATASRLGRLWTKVNADLAHPWTLDELAREAGLSREALRRQCLRECGHSPLREVTRLRLQRAGDLLRHTGDKVAAIAHRVGFGDPFAFSTAFKRAHGVPPAVWRR